MAEVFARSADAPAAIVQALSLDQASIALPVLEHSPLLIDADLVDIIATGNCQMQCAIARRINLPASVCAAIAEVGTPAAALELIENAYAELAPFSWERIVERHGHLAAIRESMLVLEDLPAATRVALDDPLPGKRREFGIGIFDQLERRRSGADFGDRRADGGREIDAAGDGALHFAIAGRDDVDEVGVDQKGGMFEHRKCYRRLVERQRLHDGGRGIGATCKNFGHRLAH